MAGQEKIPLIVVAGPTASGKTAAAVALAKKLNGEVVSADSMQIYKGMDIATAKPTVAEMEGVPHHLLDFLEPDQAFTVADYVSMAGKVIQDIYSRGKLPILAGGTGLYIHSLVDHIQFTETKNDLLLRSQLQEEAAAYGNVHMLERLRALDPAYAEKLHPNNLNRIIRGLEVCILTGQTMTQQIEESRREESPYLPCMLGLNCLDRQNLYRRINQRVDRMMEMGLLEEAQHFLARTDLKTAVQAIGYKELIPYFRGTLSLEEAVDRIKQETRRYAKRQLTWFRRDERIHWVYIDVSEENFQNIVENMQKIIAKGLEI